MSEAYLSRGYTRSLQDASMCAPSVFQIRAHCACASACWCLEGRVARITWGGGEEEKGEMFLTAGP